MTAPDRFGYDWLDFDADRPGALMNEASLFAFFEGIGVQEVVQLTGLQNATTLDLSDDPEPWERFFEIEDGPAAVLAAGAWTVLYQDNSFPQQVAESIAELPRVDRAVIVFWNVNALISFDLWERGVQIDGFSEWPSQRLGTDQNRLSADMEVVGLVDEDDDEDTSVNYNLAMLALADRITGEHLSKDFLGRPGLAVGSLPLD